MWSDKYEPPTKESWPATLLFYTLFAAAVVCAAVVGTWLIG